MGRSLKGGNTRQRGNMVLGFLLVGWVVLLAAREESVSEPMTNGTQESVESTDVMANTNLIAVAPPPFSKDIFPCSECHDPDDEVNTTRRKLDAHENIVLHHDEKNRWCMDCHDAKNRDKLHLANGTLIDFAESYKLCGQCHGPKLRNWKAGEHGKRTGEWSASGRKRYLLCASCHNPHSPKFKPLKPLPPPQRPETLK